MADTVHEVRFVPEYQVVMSRRCSYACGYCDFPSTPASLPPSRKAIRRMLRTAAHLGVHQVTLTSGEGIENNPEITSACHYFGYRGWFDYLRAICQFILQRNGRTLFFPQLDVGPIPWPDLRRLRDVAPLMRLMLHSADDSLQVKPAHMQAPNKVLERRLSDLDEAGSAGIPTVTGILVGIGESEESWLEAARAVEELNRRHGHIESFVVRPFTPVPFSAMAACAPVSDATYLQAVKTIRSALPDEITVSAELEGRLHLLAEVAKAGLTDIGVVRVATSDRLDLDLRAALEAQLASGLSSGVRLVQRMPINERFAERHRLPAPIAANITRFRTMAAAPTDRDNEAACF